MDQEGAVKQRCAGQAVPDLFSVAETFLGGMKRNEAERMIDEMSRNVRKENEAGAHAQVPPQRAHG